MWWMVGVEILFDKVGIFDRRPFTGRLRMTRHFIRLGKLGRSMLRPYKGVSRLRCWGQGHDGALREEVEWAKDKVVPHNRHDWPIFGAGYVVEAEGIPRDDVGILDGAIGFGPPGKAIIAFALGDVDAGGKAFVLFIRCDPELVCGERADFLRAVVGIEQRSRGRSRHELITGGIAERAFDI